MALFNALELFPNITFTHQIHLRLVLPSGPTPSPYDPKWSADMASPSDTSISCSGTFIILNNLNELIRFSLLILMLDLPADDSASNSAQLPPSRKDLLVTPTKQQAQQMNDASEIVAGLAVQVGKGGGEDHSLDLNLVESMDGNSRGV